MNTKIAYKITLSANLPSIYETSSHPTLQNYDNLLSSDGQHHTLVVILLDLY